MYRENIILKKFYVRYIIKYYFPIISCRAYLFIRKIFLADLHICLEEIKLKIRKLCREQSRTP